MSPRKEKVITKEVTQKKLKELAKSRKTTRVGATNNIKRRVGEYRRKGVVNKKSKVYFAKTVNMRKAENMLLKKCKAKGSCKKNKHSKSNIRKKSGHTYVVIQQK